MTFPRIALLSPGEMGQAVGALLVRHGVSVRTCLAGRSARTRELARAAKLEDAGSLEDLVASCDVILSIVPPSSARAVAADVASALSRTGGRPAYVDCNAIAPGTVRDVAAILAPLTGEFVDAGIIGPAPRDGVGTRFYASGPGVAAFLALREAGLDIRPFGPRVGDASALKMAYAAYTKGTTAIAAALLLAGHAYGVYEPLLAELRESHSDELRRMERAVGRAPTVAHRWIGEMEEIAKTFADVGVTSRLHEGAADVYRFLAGTALGAERPETRDHERTLDETIAALAAELSRP